MTRRRSSCCLVLSFRVLRENVESGSGMAEEDDLRPLDF